jgi:hypothetical protein
MSFVANFFTGLGAFLKNVILFFIEKSNMISIIIIVVVVEYKTENYSKFSCCKIDKQSCGLTIVDPSSLLKTTKHFINSPTIG